MTAPHDPGAARKPPVEHAKQAPHFGGIAVARTLVLPVFAGEGVEEAEPRGRVDGLSEQTGAKAGVEVEQLLEQLVIFRRDLERLEVCGGRLLRVRA